MKIKRLIYFVLTVIVAILAHSCLDDPINENPFPDEAGIETAVSLRIGVPAMKAVTRGEMEPGTDTKLNSLWVGIFSAATGECTYAGAYNGREQMDRLHEGGAINAANHFYNLSSIDTRSGQSYIVAVGNYASNYGYVKQDGDGTSRRQALEDILPATTEDAKNFTWTDYCNIAVMQLAAGDISTPVNNLLMSGIYTESAADESGSGWEAASWKSTYIPLSGTLPGAIHLRREISQVRFNIKPGDGDTKYEDPEQGKKRIRIVEVTPVSYRVMNAPVVAWLHERRSSGEYAAEANAGDVIKLPGTTYGSGAAAMKANYRTSALFSGSQYFAGNDDNGYEFDFWMLENKRRALAEGIGYEAREKEQKTLDDLGGTNGNDNPYETNTGIYTALCGDSGAETMNNAAAFVEIKCTLIYTNEGLDDLNMADPDRNEGIDGEYQQVYFRKADAVYTVHLGGVKKGGNPDWSDFCHRRNHKYTYNITIVDLENIRIEAVEDEENTPGQEGVVSDVINPAFEMDAHYGLCNIQLSNYERTPRDNNMAYRLEVYLNDERIIIDPSNIDTFNDTRISGKSEKLWQWIELRPTTGADVLAAYKPYGTTGGGDGRTMRLKDLADLENYPGNNGSTDKEEKTQQWYTVFVNEYVYEESSDESNSVHWAEYVNQSPRSCWIQIRGNTAQDKESVYLKSKYMITQKSIQTFYDMPEGMAGRDINGLGLEHVNETFGFNLRWYDNLVSKEGTSSTNGRLNQIKHIRTFGGTVANTNQKNWSDYYNPASLQKINGINQGSVQYDRTFDLTEGPYYVPAINTRPDHPSENATGGMIGNVWRHNINTSNYLMIMNACMNRNRDNNGNGKIDRDEIRWYLPASSEMIDLVLGSRSLTTPLIDFSRNPDLLSPDDGDTDQPHHGNTRFHYATSNHRVLWAEEGSTINEENDFFNTSWNGSPWNIPPQQIRCARPLSSNLDSDAEEAITPAFTVDDENAPTKIYPTFYEEKNLRGYSPTAIDAHQETSSMNRLCSSGFEFKKEIIQATDQSASFENTYGWGNSSWETYQFYWRHVASEIQTPGQNRGQHDYAINEANRRCQATYGEEWRVPTMKEAALIKLAINNAKIYPPGNDLWHRHLNYEGTGYDFDNFLASTYREYGFRTGGVGGESRNDKTGIYTGVLYWHPGSDHEVDRDDAGNVIGRIACITNVNFLFNIRCVRDLKE